MILVFQKICLLTERGNSPVVRHGQISEIYIAKYFVVTMRYNFSGLLKTYLTSKKAGEEHRHVSWA